ncbi:hypothetical protein [Blastomonas sp. SL216]|uniref:hypothetical protein n=1 Tax=Blastomonas sp. SL216 TaxID=2995169 RepID=UPI0023777941|nr:hypothetical protein OU999_02385 [Blastomonas sp. SL216]
MTDARPVSASAGKRNFLVRARELWELVRYADLSAQRAFRWAIVLSTLAATAEIGSLLLIQHAASALFVSSARSTIPFVQLALIGTMLTSAVLRLLGQRAVIKTQYAVATSLAILAFSRLQNQDYASYLETGASRAFAAFEELQIVCYHALVPLISGVISLGTGLLIVAVLTLLYPLLGLTILLVTIGGMMAASRFRKRPAAKDDVPELSRQRARLIYEARTAFRDICLTNGQARIAADFDDIERTFRGGLVQSVVAGQTARSEIEIAGLLVFLIAALIWPLLNADYRTLVPALGVLALGGLRLLPHLATIRSVPSARLAPMAR